MDFPTVYRAEAGLDSIIQAAGRCNREGKRPLEESIVYIYQPEGRVPPRIQPNVSIYKNEIQPNFVDSASPEAIQAYFDALHMLKGDRLDKKKVVEAFEREGMAVCFPLLRYRKSFI